MGCRRQHQIAMRHAFSHRQFDADSKYVVASKPAAHAVLVGVHDDRIVVVDEQRAQRRVDVILGEMPTDIVDVEGAGSGGEQIRPLQPGQCLRKGIAGGEHDAIALTELAEQRRQCDCGPDPATTIAPPFEPVARRQHERFGLGEPTCESQDLALLQSADGSRPRHRPFPGSRHEFLGAQDVRGNEGVV